MGQRKLHSVCRNLPIMPPDATMHKYDVWTRAELAAPISSLHVKAAPCKLVSGQVLKDDSSYLAVLHG